MNDESVVFIDNPHILQKIPFKTKVKFFCKMCGKEVIRRRYRGKDLESLKTLRCSACNHKLSYIEKYGSLENYQKQRTAKMLATFQKNWGGCGNQSDVIKNKQEKTMMKKYGVKNISSLETCKEFKSKNWLNKTLEEKQNILNKCRNTNNIKYGHDFPIQSLEILEKSKQTCLEKYGTEYVTQSDFCKKKSKQTIIEKYNYSRVPSKKYILEGKSFDSGWELAVWIWANDLGKSIKREPIQFQYEFEGKFHTYFPDFEIDDKLVEVKGTHFFKEDGTMQNPFNHDLDQLFEAKHQCGLRNNVEFWTKEDMVPIIKYVEEKYGKDYLRQFCCK